MSVDKIKLLINRNGKESFEGLLFGGRKVGGERGVMGKVTEKEERDILGLEKVITGGKGRFPMENIQTIQ